MAVVENAGATIGSSSENLDNGVVSLDSTVTNEVEKSKPRTRTGAIVNGLETDVQPVNGDQSLKDVFGHQDRAPSVPNGNYKYQITQMRNGFEANDGFRTCRWNNPYEISTIFISNKFYFLQINLLNS
ncbi:hypothetical protein K1719_023057 [Acacia pycnantha]|nr:hypothetical protein K1719_023057 [Acacia pycnantha]